MPDEPIELERAAWRALSTTGDDAAEFYERVLASQVLMLLPGGLVIDDRRKVVQSMHGEPWSSYELSDERTIPLGADAAVVAYKATAQRGEFRYTALFNSTYVREGGEWRMVLHQQTPV
jgi:hypothetical protein